MRSIRLPLASLILLILAACASPPPPASTIDPLGAAPDDFSIDLLILRGEGAPDRPEAHLQPARFVLFADGSLHYGTSADLETDRLPPRVRQLSRAEVAGLWSLIQQLGFGEPADGIAPVNFDLLDSPHDGMAYLIAFTGDERRWVFLRPSAIDGEPDAASARLARRMAQLAWATDLPAHPIAVIPKRYDFGPDPYVRYRQP